MGSGPAALTGFGAGLQGFSAASPDAARAALASLLGRGDKVLQNLPVDDVFIDDTESDRRLYVPVGDAGRAALENIDEGLAPAKHRTIFRFDDDDVVQLVFPHFFRQRLGDAVRSRGNAARSKPHKDARLPFGVQLDRSGSGLFYFLQLGKTSDFGRDNHTLTLQT
jgi:hypothetical protein